MNHRNGHRLRPDKKIAYIIGSYPLLTTTFVDREILEAKRVGVELTLVAIRRGSLAQIGPEVRHLAEEAIYLLPAPWLKFLGAHLSLLATSFGTYLATLTYLLTRPYPSVKARLKTVLHFGEGVWAAALLKGEGVDHVHAHFADRAATVALIVARFLKIDYSLTAHANDIYLAPVLLAEKISNARFATTCTGYNKRYLETTFGYPVELVYHGLDLTPLDSKPAPALQPDRPLMISVGQLKEKKGFPDLIRACRILKEQGYHFQCEIIGEGPDRDRLAALIAELDLSAQVTLCGALPNSAVMEKYSQATLFVLACKIAANDDRDGIPNVVLEALANRLPVISTRVSGIPEVIEPNVTGLLVEPEDQAGLARAIASVLDRPAFGRQLGEQGYQFVKQHFDIRTNIGRLVELFGVSIADPTPRV